MLLSTRRSRPIVDASASSAAAPGRGIGIGGGLELHGVGRCDGANVVPGVDSGGQVELRTTALPNQYRPAIAVDLVLRTSQYTVLPYDHKGDKYRRRRGVETHGTQMRSLRFAIAERLLQNLRESGASRFLDHLLLALELLLLVLICASSLCSIGARDLDPRRHPLAGDHGRRIFFLFHKLS